MSSLNNTNPKEYTELLLHILNEVRDDIRVLELKVNSLSNQVKDLQTYKQEAMFNEYN